MRRRTFLLSLLSLSFARRRALSLELDDAKESGAERGRKLSQVVHSAVGRGELAGGSLVVLHRGEAVVSEAFGFTDLESRRPFTVDQLCYLASLTKPVVATLFAILDHQGVVSLDDPIAKWLPEFRNIKVRGKTAPAKPLRLWHLLCQRSGLPGNRDPGAIRSYRQLPAPGQAPSSRQGAEDRISFGQPASLAEIVSGWAGGGLFAEPGTRFSWGSAGSLAAARVAEVATGQGFEALTREILLDPLGMDHTTYRPSQSQLERLPRSYLRTPDGLELEQRGVPWIEKDGLINPGGGLFSTAEDMGRFFLLHNQRGVIDGRRLVSEAALARLYSLPAALADQSAPAVSYGRSQEEGPYGLGWNLAPDRSWVRHLGAIGSLGWVDLRVPCAGVFLSGTPWDGDKRLADEVIEQTRSTFS